MPTFTGTMGDETLTGGVGDDTLEGIGGSDLLQGGDGNDLFVVAPSDDGADTFEGGSGDDTIAASANDTAIRVASLSGIEAISAGGFSGVSIVGTANGDALDLSGVALTSVGVIDGAGGADTLVGSSAADSLVGGAGDDDLSGGDGADTLQIDSSGDSVAGGNGADTVTASANGVAISLFNLTGVEAVSGGGHTGVTLVGTSAGEVVDVSGLVLTGVAAVDAGDGADTVIGTADADTLIGGLGDDSLAGGDGADTLLINSSGDVVDGGNGADTVVAVANGLAIGLSNLTGVEAISAAGYAGVTLVGTTAGEVVDVSGLTLTNIAAVDGGDGADTVIGTGAADTLIGGLGDDSVSGGDGDDVLRIDASGDVVDGGNGADTVAATANGLALSLSNFTGVEAISAVGFTGVTIAGTASSEVVDVSALALTNIAGIDAGDGADTVIGSAGADTIIGGTGDDSLSGGNGADRLQIDSAGDVVNGGSGADTVAATANGLALTLSNFSGVEAVSATGYTGVTFVGTGSADVMNFAGLALTNIAAIEAGLGADTVTGSAGADNILGGDDADEITGGAGSDTLSGGNGDDTFKVGVGHGVDAIDGGAGADTIVATADNTVITVSSLAGIEAISSGGFSNVGLRGSANGEVLDVSGITLTGITVVDGAGGADTLIGGAVAETFNGGAGDDSIQSGDGADVIQFGLNGGFDAVDTGNGADTLTAVAANAMIGIQTMAGVEAISSGGFSNVWLAFTGANDSVDLSQVTVTSLAGIDMGAGDDTLTGSNSADTMLGGDGNDLLNPVGVEYDSIVGGDGYDTIQAAGYQHYIRLSGFSGIEMITANGYANVTVRGSPTNDVFDFSNVTLVGITQISAGEGNDVLIGSSGADTIAADFGDDTQFGGNGDDVFAYGGAVGFDVLDGGAGNDGILVVGSITDIGLRSFTGIEWINGGGFNPVLYGDGSDNFFDFASVTITGITRIDGNTGNDTIIGNAVANTIAGGAGNDSLSGDGGNDQFLVYVGDGVDAYDGGSGSDTILAGAHNAVIGISSLAGVEAISGGVWSNVIISGTSNADYLDFSSITLTAIQTIAGGDGADTLIGNYGIEYFRGGEGADSLSGGSGNDRFYYHAGDTGFDDVDGGGSYDAIWGMDGAPIYVRSFTGIEALGAYNGTSWLIAADDSTHIDLTGISLFGSVPIDAGGGNDTITGNYFENTLVGGLGDDVIRVTELLTNDSVDGGGGNDVLEVIAYNVALTWGRFTGVETVVTNLNTSLVAGNTHDTIDLNTFAVTAGFSRVDGSGGNDTIIGSDQSETLFGGLGEDSVIGGNGNDTLDGGAGNDTLSGGNGDDLFFITGASSGDHFVGGDGYDQILANAAVKIAIGSLSGIEHISTHLQGTGVTGSALSDNLDFTGITFYGVSSIDALNGNDTIAGLSGMSLSGGNGDDMLIAGHGGLVMNGGAGNDTLIGGDGHDLLQMSAGTDSFAGGLGNDTLVATAANQLINWGMISGFEALSNGGFSGVKIVGGAGDDYIDLNAVSSNISRVELGTGNDVFIGTSGNETIVGGANQDFMTGGGGSDTFVFTAVSESAAWWYWDVITDYASGDIIDLAGIDANSVSSGNQAFTWIGSGAFTNVRGQLRYDTGTPGKTYVFGDVNGDGAADFHIELTGTHALVAGNFVL